MKIKPGVFPRYRIRKDLKSFKFGGFNTALPGVECTIISGPFYDEIKDELCIEIEFYHPVYKCMIKFTMLPSEIERV